MQDPDKAHSKPRPANRNSQNGHQDPDDDELDDLPPDDEGEEEEEKPVPRRASRPAYRGHRQDTMPKSQYQR